MKSYAVLFAPEFRLQATLRSRPEWIDQPAALLETLGTKPLVAELNARAQCSQVQRGMTPTQALARCGNLHLLQGNRGHERSAQEMMLQTAEVLSPFLEITAPGVITIELPGERCFDEEELIRKCVGPLRSMGLETRMGVAATPDLALLAARYGEPVRLVESATAFLEALPMAALEPSEELLSVLQAWGIRVIGQWVALPMGQACERLGPEAVALWERAHGGRPRPLRLVKPREFFAEASDLDHAVEMLEPLLFLLRRFLEQIAARLAQAYLVAGKLRLVLRFEQGAPYRCTFTIPQPTRAVDLLFRMLHTHLENFTSPSPIVGLELAAQPVRPSAEQFSLLEKGLRDPHQFAETLARLEALLGSDRVGTPEMEPSHHPEAFHLRPYAVTDQNHETIPSPLVGVPCFRFRPPLTAQVILADFQPVYLSSARTTGQIKEARGPWYSEGNWWEPRRWSREEWDIATADGIYRIVQVEAQWFLDGIYA
jgi:protein ImuB